MIVLNQKTWDLLQRVNSKVNNGVKYQSDQKTYGKFEKWALPDHKVGDCEDYALSKQAALKDLGIRSWLVKCQTERGGPHIVLSVDTDKGSLILDNRYFDVRRYEDLKYKWHSVESHGEKWRAIL